MFGFEEPVGWSSSQCWGRDKSRAREWWGWGQVGGFVGILTCVEEMNGGVFGVWGDGWRICNMEFIRGRIKSWNGFEISKFLLRGGVTWRAGG